MAKLRLGVSTHFHPLPHPPHPLLLPLSLPFAFVGRTISRTTTSSTSTSTSSSSPTSSTSTTSTTLSNSWTILGTNPTVTPFVSSSTCSTTSIFALSSTNSSSNSCSSQTLICVCKPTHVLSSSTTNSRSICFCSASSSASMSSSSSSSDDMTTMANGFLDFVNASPSPYHAVANAAGQLKDAGFKKVSEKDTWSLSKGDKFYVTRNQGSIVAVEIGANYTPGNGAMIYGAHTDSPCLKVKPVSTVSKSGYLEVGVECYGGGLWHTWFDRDLAIGGRVIVKTGLKSFVSRLVHIKKPILRIPTLAIHLSSISERESFSFNKETQLIPVLCTEVKNALNQANETDPESDSHHPALLNLLAQELDVAVDDIYDFDLCLADCQDAVIGGIYNEFIFSPRLDNLMMSYTGLKAFIDAESTEKDSAIRVLALFDHEEVGSTSSHGANSNLLPQTISRVIKVLAKDVDQDDIDEQTVREREGRGGCGEQEADHSDGLDVTVQQLVLCFRRHGTCCPSQLQPEARSQHETRNAQGNRDQSQQQPKIRNDWSFGVLVQAIGKEQ
eukprot:TRINITY_DN816_c0_g1_i4.p1 TRINITY_DN816_c0_g1~~TRINITY_DN816_c0_g1_i4.p1  ORF type:complete len:556 (-),score=128.44 TRINITY_DN816_c0_g1_i4:355-2022(-)